MAKKKITTKTKRGSASRYGPRYGAKHKKAIQKAEETKRKQDCPVCGRKSLNKRGYIWVCSKCKAEISGGAYAPKTLLGGIVDKILEKKHSKVEMEKILAEVEKPTKEKPKTVKKKPTAKPKKEEPVKEETKKE